MATRENEQLLGFTNLDEILPKVSVVDNLTSTSTDTPLSANQGRVLKELIDANSNSGSSSYTLPVATNEELGGVRLVSEVRNTTSYNEPTTTTGRTYCVQLNEANQMVVNVPWTDTITESSGESGSTVAWEGRLSTGYEIGTLTIDGTNYNIFVPETTSYTLPTATVGALGGVRLYSSTVQTTTPNSVTSTSGRTYAVQLNSSNLMVVNVPWTDTNTTGTYYEGQTLTSSNNLDSLTDNGIYIFASDNMPTGLPDEYPATTGGGVEVWTNGTRIFQRVSDCFGNGCWVRMYSGTSWLSWCKVSGDYTLPVASTSALGGVRLYSSNVQTVSPNATTATSGRTYAVQLNANNQMVVNVPWTDTGASMGNVIVISRSITGFGGYDLSGESGMDYTIGEYILDTDVSPYVLYQIVSSSTNSSGRDKQVVAWDTSTLYIQGSSLYVWSGSALVSVSSSANLSDYVSKSSSSLQTITGPLAAEYFLETSDERLKYDIKPVGNRTDVLDIEYKEFKWSATDHTGFGVIAQEVEPIVPEAVSETSEGFKTVNYSMLHSLQINALMNKIKELETKIEELRNG